jgi:hypothetical protein
VPEKNGANGNGEVVVYCECRELVVNGKRQPIPHGHDCDYERVRTALIGEAERIATAKAGTRDTGNGNRWTKIFAQAMEELAKRCL